MNVSSINRRSPILFFAVCCVSAMGCETGEDKPPAGRPEPLQISFSVVKQFQLPGVTSTPEIDGTAATPQEEVWATTLSLAPNGKSLLAIAFGRTAVYL